MAYKIVYAIFYAMSLLPYRVMYCISDFFYLIIYYIVRYRKNVVRKNLTTAFPDKDEKEIESIEKGYYHWLCDYFVEALKLLSVSDKTLLKHIEFRNVEELEQHYDKGQTCAAILGHYCNWELLSATGLAFKRHKDAVCGLIYHPLRSDIFDELFKDISSISATGRIYIRPVAEMEQYPSVAAFPKPRHTGIHRRREDYEEDERCRILCGYGETEARKIHLHIPPRDRQASRTP